MNESVYIAGLSVVLESTRSILQKHRIEMFMLWGVKLAPAVKEVRGMFPREICQDCTLRNVVFSFPETREAACYPWIIHVALVIS